jgi:hypothetical protein
VIPYQFALVTYVAVAALLMLDRNRARGLSLAFLGAMLFMPAQLKVDLPVVPNLEKDNVWIVGALLGTLLFHPNTLASFRFRPSDFLLLAVLPCTVLTSVLNDFGVYDGVSRSLDFLLNVGFLAFLVRLHIDSAAALRTFLLFLIGGAAIYAPLALFEFRMSPQLHNWTYGYFQHVFIQHMRGSLWRPIVFMPHALALGRLFAFTAFLALLPMRKDLEQRFGIVGRHLYLLPLLGLVLSISYGPYLLFALLCAGWYLLPRARWVALVIPAIAMLWLILVLLGMRPGYGIVDLVSLVNVERAQSLDYRLIALQEYRDIVVNRIWFGHGGWGHGRIAGRATDAQALVGLLERGVLGFGFYYAWWIAGLIAALQMMRKSAGTIFHGRALAIALLGAMSLAVVVIDAGFDPHFMVLTAAILSLNAKGLVSQPQRPVALKPPPVRERVRQRQLPRTAG